jgi:hypothetical protein
VSRGLVHGALAAAVVAGFAACQSSTEMVVVVSAGDVVIPGDVDRVRVFVTNTMGSSPDLPLCAGAGGACLTLPLVATLIPGPKSPGDEVTVQVIAYRNDQPVIREAASFVFQSGQRDRLDFVLYKDCLGHLSCADRTPPQSCGADGQCSQLQVTPLGPDPVFDGGGNPVPDLGVPDLNVPDLGVADLTVSRDSTIVFDQTMSAAPDLLLPDLTPPQGFAANSCVAAASIPASGGFPAATCAAYCAGIQMICTNSCTTNRGGADWGVEAWYSDVDCGQYIASAGQANCTDDLNAFSEPTVAKYRCCCQ